MHGENIFTYVIKGNYFIFIIKIFSNQEKRKAKNGLWYFRKRSYIRQEIKKARLITYEY